MSEEIRQIPVPQNDLRIESGAIQFEGDWPSFHLRGDAAIAAAILMTSIFDWIEEQAQTPDAVPIDVILSMAQLKWIPACICTKVRQQRPVEIVGAIDEYIPS